jgi:hypothetical protein
MSAATRTVAFGVILAAAMAIGSGIGATIGPDASQTETTTPAPMGQGVVATRDGYRMVPTSPELAADGGTFRFTIVDRDEQPVAGFTPVHERDLHLIVVNRELTNYHHVHPQLADDGTWTIDLPALPAGSYRAIADFQVEGGPRLALGSDVSVAGNYTPTVLPEPHTTTEVDGYDVSINTEVGKGGEVTASLTVTRDGHPVDNLQRYLGANGHLVAIRAGDLAYVHVHPVDEHTGPPHDGTVTFNASLDAAGRYGLFFDFQHNGIVHTAAFTFDQGTVTGAADMEH